MNSSFIKYLFATSVCWHKRVFYLACKIDFKSVKRVFRITTSLKKVLIAHKYYGLEDTLISRIFLSFLNLQAKLDLRLCNDQKSVE